MWSQGSADLEEEVTLRTKQARDTTFLSNTVELGLTDLSCFLPPMRGASLNEVLQYTCTQGDMTGCHARNWMLISLPDLALLGCRLVSLHFRCDILSGRPVLISL